MKNDDYIIEYSEEAVVDLRGIYSYISETILSPNIASLQVGRIREEIKALCFFPRRNPIVEWEPWNTLKMHKFQVDNYMVFYIVDELEKVVTVVRIFYSGRDIKNIISSDN